MNARWMMACVMAMACGAAAGEQPEAPEGGCLYRGKPRDAEWFEVHYAEWRQRIAAVEGRWIDVLMANTHPTRMEPGDAGLVMVQLHKIVSNRGCIVRLGRRGQPTNFGTVFDDRCQKLFVETEGEPVQREWTATLAVVGMEKIDGKEYPRAVRMPPNRQALTREEFRVALADGYVLRTWKRVQREARWRGRTHGYYVHVATDVR